MRALAEKSETRLTLLRSVLSVEDRELGEHAHVSSLKTCERRRRKGQRTDSSVERGGERLTESSLHERDQLVEVAVLLVELDEGGELLALEGRKPKVSLKVASFREVRGRTHA